MVVGVVVGAAAGAVGGSRLLGVLLRCDSLAHKLTDQLDQRINGFVMPLAPEAARAWLSQREYADG